MREDSLTVYVNRHENGALFVENAQYIYNYRKDAADIVSLTMPIRQASWVSKTLHPVFQMNMPEGALKEAIKNHFAKLQTMDDMNMLRLIGPYMLGRVKFGLPDLQAPGLEIEEILHSSKESLFEELMEKFAIRSGISGVQPKLLLTAHNKTTMQFEHYIVKSWEASYPQLALNEYFCMRAISHAGLPTPEFYLSQDRSMFVMKRFDIDVEGKYLGFEDMCVLTARSTDEKYQGSYEEIARVIKDVIPPSKRKASLRTFFTALVMNHLLKNGDAHLKNYGILYTKDFVDASLAPIYDVITTTCYLKNDIPALKLSDGKLWWKEKTYRTFAKQNCGLSNREYEAVLAACQTAIIKSKKEIDAYETDDASVKAFLALLKGSWSETL